MKIREEQGLPGQNQGRPMSEDLGNQTCLLIRSQSLQKTQNFLNKVHHKHAKIMGIWNIAKENAGTNKNCALKHPKQWIHNMIQFAKMWQKEMLLCYFLALIEATSSSHAQ